MICLQADIFQVLFNLLFTGNNALQSRDFNL